MAGKYKKQHRSQDTQKRIVVLGSRGMLGNDLMNVIMGNYSVQGLDFGEIDIAHRGPCITTIKELRPHLVINAAAYTDVDGCETNREHAFNVNANGARNVAIACHESQIRLLHISTDYVFDGTKTEPYHEDDEPNPLGVYAKSKFEGEKLVRQFHPHATICRTSWLYGKHGKNFVATIIKLAQKGANPLKIVNDQVGSPTYTLDCAKALIKLIDMDTPPVIHITNDGYCSWFQFARKILDTTGFTDVVTEPISSKEYGSPAPRPAYSVLNCDRFAKLTGSKLRHWDASLIDFLEDLI